MVLTQLANLLQLQLSLFGLNCFLRDGWVDQMEIMLMSVQMKLELDLARTLS